MRLHPTYIARVPSLAADGTRVVCFRPCCEGCGWSGQLHAARRNAVAEEREHREETAAPAPEVHQGSLFELGEVA